MTHFVKKLFYGISGREDKQDGVERRGKTTSRAKSIGKIWYLMATVDHSGPSEHSVLTSPFVFVVWHT